MRKTDSFPDVRQVAQPLIFIPSPTHDKCCYPLGPFGGDELFGNDTRCHVCNQPLYQVTKSCGTKKIPINSRFTLPEYKLVWTCNTIC